MLERMLFIVAGLCLGIGCQYPETYLAVVLTWMAVVLLTVASKQAKPSVLTNIYVFGVVFSACAFYWIPQTLVYFGGFEKIIAYIFFALYCLLSSLQFVFCGWLYLKLEQTRLRYLLLSFPLAWATSEFLWPKLFPWSLVHPLISWASFSSLAGFVGVIPLSALLLWWGRYLVAIFEVFVLRRSIAKPAMVAMLLSVLVLIVGSYRTSIVENEIAAASKVKIGVIQGNLEAKQKGDLKYFEANIETYQKLTREAVNRGAEFIVWPESIVVHWMPEDTREIRHTKFDPDPGLGVPLLFGGLTYRLLPEEQARKNIGVGVDDKKIERERVRYFNSAIGIDENGFVMGLYHKRILMPFGEYMPWANIFPWLKDVSPQTGDFNFGDRIEPLHFKLNRGQGREVIAGTLICYEDLVPKMSVEAENLGANLLINLTNDAWYGDSAALRQHHMLAMWRAIETDRFLIRATNTGFTGIVSPLGKTISALPTFSSGILVDEIPILSGHTFYSFMGDSVSWFITLIVLVFVFASICAKGAKL